MIGQMFNCYPNFNQLLATYRRNPTKDKYTLCIDMFSTLIEHFQKKGHIEDKLFENMGFLMGEVTN